MRARAPCASFISSFVFTFPVVFAAGLASSVLLAADLKQNFNHFILEEGTMKSIKHIIGLLTLALFLAAPTLALAAEQMGVYVTPKFIYGYTQMNGLKGQYDNNNGDTFAKGNAHDSVFGGALAVGYDASKKFRIPVRAELEYTVFSQAEGKNSRLGETWYIGDHWRRTIEQKLRIQTLFANVYYDFRNSTPFTPYLGAGLGLAFINAKGRYHAVDTSGTWPSESASAKGKNTTNFAWNIGFGAAYDITNWCSVDIGYRFAGLGGAKSKWDEFRAKTKDIYMHQVITGVRFTF